MHTNCGVYCWFNTCNGKRYVGSTVNFVNRRRQHGKRLRAGTHGNPHFQAAWNLYGEDAFDFRVLESCAPDIRHLREQVWIDRYQTHDARHGYNRVPAYPAPPTEVLRASSRGRPKSPEHRAKIAAAHLGKPKAKHSKPKIHTPEAIAKIRASLKGRQPTSEQRERHRKACNTPEYRTRLRAASRAWWDAHPEAKDRVSVRLGGKPLSKEHRTKIGQAGRGQKRTPEAKAAMSKAQTERRTRERESRGCPCVQRQP